MPYEFGDIVLVPFPFTDQTGAKKRPAVIISARAYNRARPDLLLMAVTSQLRPSAGFGEVWLNDWQGAGLIKPSAVKPLIATIEQSLIIRALGVLSPDDQSSLRGSLSQIIG